MWLSRGDGEFLSAKYNTLYNTLQSIVTLIYLIKCSDTQDTSKPQQSYLLCQCVWLLICFKIMIDTLITLRILLCYKSAKTTLR